ncbi:MAG: hypothetical protein MJ050_00925 [Phascolarctobacterium sp.]|nr:hypothetical protein [Phascolarctobacterium sp.]
MINVLALPLEEGVKRLEACGMECKCKALLPPRESLEAYNNLEVRKYIVRQQQLSDKEIEITFVFR